MIKIRIYEINFFNFMGVFKQARVCLKILRGASKNDFILLAAP